MSYNGSGLFQINTSGQPVVAGTVITASAFNALTADLATGLTTAITKDGQTATTAQIPFAQGLRSTLTTDSTNSTSGSIITDGGLGVAKAVNIGTTLGVTGAVTGSSTITGTKFIPTGTSATGNGMYLPAANVLGFSTNGTLAAVIDANQNVGVGVTPKSTLTSTTRSLQLPYSLGLTSFTGSLDTYLHSNLYPSSLASGWANYATGGGNLFRMNGGAFYWYQAASGAADANSSLTQAMTLDANGALLMGMTSAIGTERINIQGKTNNGQDYNILTTGATSGVTAYAMRMFSSTASAVVGSIQFTSSATTYNTSSDYRLKENIAPMTGALATVAQLKPCTYTWKVDGSDGQGFIAHELAEVVPDAVSGEKDGVNEDGSIKPQGIDTSFLVATLTAAIQEQQALITTLTERITALENA